jgi:predicted SAM-dependent methyltransferase
MKINLGCGSNFLAGWVNHDSDVDITKPLPFADSSADVIFAEHVAEHTTPQQAWNFFEECHRVLRPGGVVRIAVPSVERIAERSTPDYEQWVHRSGFCESPTQQSVIKAIVFHHGHQSAWSGGVLLAFLTGVGFKDAILTLPSESYHGLDGVNGHWRVIGEAFNDLETVTAEAVK